MFKAIAFSGLIGVSGRTYQKGFVRMPRMEGIEVETTTDEMRLGAPSKVDWTSQGATTPIKDQGGCGSCWAYSTTETIESGYFMATGKLMELSEQQIISCDKTDGGCNGGDIPSAAKYVMDAGGIESESHYPDTSNYDYEDGHCEFSRSHIVVKVDSYKFAIPECTGGSCNNQQESDIMPQLAKHGPLAICVNAQSWNSYNGGIVKDCPGKYNDIDHCVQLVGYDNEHSTPYWKVRNSWGRSWGEDGHIRLAMGSNVCGVATEVVIIKASTASVANVSVVV